MPESIKQEPMRRSKTVEPMLQTTETAKFLKPSANPNPITFFLGSSDRTKYTYDGLGRRITMHDSVSDETRHFYHNNQQVIEERVDSATTADQQYVWGVRYIDGLILRDRNNGTGGHWGLNSSGLDERILSLQDANFNTVALLNASGTVIERFTYTAYGEVKKLNPDFTDYDGATDYEWAYLYTGRRLDEETGLYFYRARYYHCQVGRFVNRDPIGYSGSRWNLYEYVSGSPMNQVVPQGTVPITCQCYDSWYSWDTSPVEVECGGRASTCCTSACSETYGWSGRWDIVGAGPSDEPDPFGEALEAMSCVQNCVSEMEGELIAAVVGLGTVGGYTYAFSTVENAGQAMSASARVSRISIWATKTKSCCPNVSQALLNERNAVQALRNALRLRLLV